MANDLTFPTLVQHEPEHSGSARAIVTVCKTCRARHVDEDGNTQYGDRVGEDVSRRLADELRMRSLDELVALAEISCMSGCGRPCSVAVQAPGKAGYLFGDIETDEDIAAIAAFAGQHIDLEDGWCSSLQRPDALKRKTLARLPAPLPVPPLAGKSHEASQ
jgi:predicted metal-binding protein